MNSLDIEKLEYKYLKKYYYFLKFAEDEMFRGFKTKEDIKDDWWGLYGNSDGKGISDFAVGAERIVYSLLNGKGIGQPNSSPVGSDLFFEVKDAYIHLDMKTVNLDNIGDYTNSIFIGENQNSYRGDIIKSTGKSESYNPALPTFYNKGKKDRHGKSIEKVCLTYFITILYEKKDLSIKVISIDSMPNGDLYSHYGDRPLCAGKNPGKARFNLKEVNRFELLPNSPSRIAVVYFDQSMPKSYLKRLSLFKDRYIE